MRQSRKKRFVRRLDTPRQLKPTGVMMYDTVINEVFLDEFEAIRLCDYEGLSQIEAAKEMHVSRGTIQRLLESARKKTVDAMLHQKTLEIKNHINNIKLKGENKLSLIDKKNIKVAFASNDKVTIEPNFSQTKEFAIYSISNYEITEVKYISPRSLRPSIFPETLEGEDVDLVITSRMTPRLIHLCKNAHIDVILGAKGRIDVNLNEYLGGFLSEDNQVCETE